MLDLSQEAILAKILRTEENEIKEALTLINDYKIVRIPKKKGHRTVYIPPEPLKKIQKKINKYLFRKIWDVGYGGLFGIYPGTSYIAHAKQHRNAQWFFQFDLEDAFPSINISTLKEIVHQKIYNAMINFEFEVERAKRLMRIYPEVQNGNIFFKVIKNSAFFSLMNLMVFEENRELSRFCPPFYMWIFPQREKIVRDLTDLIIKLTSYQGILPQGTPTAPFLFYIYLVEKRLLAELQSICPLFYPESQDRYNFQISVYIDNFVISGQKPIPKRNQEELLRVIEKFDFKVNSDKTRHRGIIHGAPLITGLRITNDNNQERKVVLPKRKIRQWRGLIYRAIFEPSLRPKVNGLIASLKPIYSANLPPQIKKPYQKLLRVIEEENHQTPSSKSF